MKNTFFTIVFLSSLVLSLGTMSGNDVKSQEIKELEGSDELTEEEIREKMAELQKELYNLMQQKDLNTKAIKNVIDSLNSLVKNIQ